MDINQLRKMDPEDLTAHDVVTLVVLAGFAASGHASPDEIVIPKLVGFSREVADEFLKQREVK